MITDKEIEDRVEMWNWNMNIFEVYDEIRDEGDETIARLLAHAYQAFNEDSAIADLAYHLGVDISEVKGLCGKVLASV
tara:strand:- start:1952 stop:2185 length:234 start_codon:yes stop_codon:yes gene_type:complete